MFRTKKDVDRHTQEVLQKITNEKDRNLRCLSIAQLYYNVQDYESAKRYVLTYLSVKDDSPIAHKLLGQCYEQFNDKPKALQEYIVSLQADSKQSELVLKVCELICESDTFDKNQAKQWFAIGEKQFPYHPNILKLKTKLFLLDDNNYISLETSLTEQIRNKPNDPGLPTQLLTFYIENGRIKDAYDEAFNKPRHFTPTIQWYQCAVKICKMYKMKYPNALQEDFYANNLLSLERLLALAVQDVKISRKSITECVSFLARFDETLSDAVLLVNKSLKFQKIINHMCGQLCFHAANIICRKLKWEDVKSPQELNQLISPLLLLSTCKDFKIVEDRSTNDSLYRTYNICVIQNAYRILQAEFVLHGMAKGNSKEFIEKIFHLCVGDFWKERISEKLYSTSDYSKFKKSSFFMTYSTFSNLPSELSSQVLENVEKKINVIETVNPISLHHLVWLGVNYIMLSDKKSLSDMYLSYQFYARKFNALSFCNSSNSSPYAESLCRLDVDAFLYASVFCAKSYVDQQISSDKHYVFPADVSKPMCSAEQEQWWEYAYQMSSKTIPDSGIPRSRSTLQRGIEAVRLSGNTSLPLPLLVLLGRTFSNRAAVESDSDKASALEERAALYWKAALPLLENIARSETITNTPKTIFEYHGSVITKVTANTLIDEGKRIVGMHLIKSNDYSDSACDQFNESYADLNTSVTSSNAGVSVTANLWGDKIIQSMLELNAKITDKLETLFNKQELLCSNQFQLLEMISTLTKKVDALALPDCDEYLDRLVNQTTVTPATPSASNVPVGFPSSLSTWTPTSVACLPPQFQTTSQIFPNSGLSTPKGLDNLPANHTAFVPPPTQFNNALMPGVTPKLAATANFMQKHPHLNAYVNSPGTMRFNASTGQWELRNDLFNLSLNSSGQYLPESPMMQSPAQAHPASSITSKLEPAYGAVSGYVSTTQQQQYQSQAIPSSTSFSFISQPSVLPGSFSFTSSVRKTSPTTVPVAATIAAENTTCPNNRSFTASTLTNFGFSTKTSPAVSGTPPTSTTTPSRPSYHIPMPDTSSLVQSSPPIQVPQDEDDDDEIEPVEHDAMPDFKPIIPLPDEIVVKTGEEGEQIVYENRVKLFRFVDKEWKERGTGIYKLLKNPTTGRVRALMRREMVHKVCANHLLSEETQLSPMKTSDRAWIYCAADYADETVKVEQFCIKFKNPEEATKFKGIFDRYRDESVKAAKESPKKPNSLNVTPTHSTPISKSVTPQSATLATTETPKKSNDTSKVFPKSNLLFGSTTVTAVSTSIPVATVATSKTPSFTSSTSNTSTSESPAFVFGAPKLQTTTAPVANQINKSTPETTKPSPFAGFGGFSLNSLPKSTISMTSLFQQQQQPLSMTAEPKSSTTESTDKDAVAEPAPFSNISSNVIDFQKLSQSSGNAFTKSKDFKGFDGAGSLVFGGAAGAGSKTSTSATSSPVAAILKNILPQSPKTSASNASDSLKGDESSMNESRTAGAGDEEEFVPTQEFSPVIPLPELVEVKTGEEGLEVLFEERCKLYRFTGEEWKERGVGNMKILRDPETGHVRLVMRREQVHKVCCNHRILKEHELKPHTTSEKAWTWCAQDYSENELKNETFCIRFKTIEQANTFKDAFNRAKSTLESPQKAPSSSKITTTEAPLPKLSEMFKPASGSWECKMCYVRNKGDVDTCASCTSPKNPSEQKSVSGGGESSFVDNKSSFSGGGGFTFGIPSSEQGNSPNLIATTTTASATAPLTSTKFSFGSGAVDLSSSSSQVSSNASAPSSFSFGSGSTFFSFGNSTSASTNGTASTTVSQQSQNKGSGFTFAPVASQVQSSSSTTVTNTSSTFTPIVSTPQTGSSKSLFSFGNLNVSSSPTVSIFKTPPVPNTESITADSSSANNEVKPWFSTPFQSTATSKPQENASVFGNAGVTITPSFNFGGKAQENVSIFGGNSAVKSLSTNTSLFGSPESSKSANTSGAFSSFTFKLPSDLSISQIEANSQKEIKDNASDSPASSEVEFVSETQSTEEEKKLAESLLLPSNFFAYKYQEDCPGCIGCDEEDKKKKENKENQTTKNTQQSNLFSSTTSSPFSGFDLKVNDTKPNSIFGDLTNNTSWLGKSTFKVNNSLNLSTNENASVKSNTQDGSEDDDEVVKNDQDPYFEPIIPLPDIVEVKTGEEHEEIKFCERAKLFRYDDKEKQWKERGIGELKVLYHPVEKTYRLLMRREQVHKVVLNQRITSSLSLQPLPSSRTSWCWFGMNLPDQESEPVLEKLAAKFKTEAQTTKFFDVVQESLFDIGTVQNDESAITAGTAATSDGDEDDEHEYGEGNYDDTAYEEYDDREYEDGDDEYDADYYVDEEAIGDAMEDLDSIKEILFENEVHVEVLESDTSVEYDGVVKLVKKFDEDKEDDVGCIVFSTSQVHALYKADIVEGMNAINEGNGNVAFVELNSDQYERKMVLQFENEDIAEEFAVSFRTLNVPACPRNH